LTWAAEIACLDEVTAVAWRAPIREELDGWELRYGYGITGRANSTWPRRDGGGLALGDRIARLEAWYRERGLPPKVQLSPASEPAGLDDEFARRGWERSSDVLIETAEASTVEPDRSVDLLDRPDDAWLDVWLGERAIPRDQLDRVLPMLVGGDTVFVRVDDIAVGRGTYHDGWVAVTCMYTRADSRRRGGGRAVLAALVGWARARGARLCLNVAAENGPARALYEGAGFEPRYPYWYRTGPA
jgi:N-acetylglutamate synthase